ncbi:hypothetical protein BHM03_00042497 [Ensete ventricosum]|nr:hypothetical protein BHM03_00042497 [Ensete ventricosum]
MYTVPFDPISQENLLGLGRAGRYGSKFSSGEVTCIDAEDLPLLHSSLKSSSPLLEHYVLCIPLGTGLSFVLQRAGLFPTFDLLSLYSRLHSRMGFHGILVPTSHNALKELESVHKVLDLYVWLSFRMEDSFPDRDVASSQKAICSLLIEEFLERLGWQRQAKGNYQHNSLLLQQRIQSSML